MTSNIFRFQIQIHIPELKHLKLSKLDTEHLNIAQEKINQYSEELDKLINEENQETYVVANNLNHHRYSFPDYRLRSLQMLTKNETTQVSDMCI